ncbi:hypothetical protein ZTR_01108 [Talaromyces verruculosus]|nr:hypothetical protein ZTR_01108 [Talaromyces verruculosus]
MFDTTYRPSSAQRLADQMEQLNEGPVPNCTMDDLSVGDVFSPQMDIDLENEGVKNIAPRRLGHAQADEPPAPSRTNLPTTGAQVLQLHEKAASRRRKKKGKRADVEVGHGNPALSTVRGFTPIASGDEDSDMSTAGSRVMSPQLNAVPPTNMPSGISALKLQLDALTTGPKS